MKRIILLIASYIAIVHSIVAERTTGATNLHKQSTTNENTEVNRSYQWLQINVTYDSDEQTIEISAEESVVGEIYLYDENEAIVDYATTINGAILSIPTPSIYTIVIQNENWYATGIISF